MLWKAARGAAVLQRKLQRTRRLSLPLLAVIGLSLPVTGWWLTHLAGWPLGQLWLLASSVLFVVLVALVPLLAGRLAGRHRATPPPHAMPAFTACWYCWC